MNPQLNHQVGWIGNAFGFAIVACASLLSFPYAGATYNQSATKPVAPQAIPDPATPRDAPEVQHWKLNRQRSIFEPGPGPQSATLAISAGPGGHHFTKRSVRPDGTVLNEDFVLPMDGKDHDIPGLPRCGTLRAHKLDSLTSKLECKKDGKLLFTSVSVLLSDGSEITTVRQGTMRDGRPFRNIETWERKE